VDFGSAHRQINGDADEQQADAGDKGESRGGINPPARHDDRQNN
jgi:hypothetical protein